MMKVTIKDVAKAAGVSPSTVSRALHNNNRISPEVRARVRKVAQELNFHPNQMARSLVSRRSRIIGVVFPNDLRMDLGNPFFPSVLQGLGHAASERHYHILLVTGSSSVTSAQACSEVVDSGYVSGLVQLTAASAPAEDCGVPTVVIGHPLVPERRFVDNNNVEVGRAAAQHLLDNGHRRILLLGYDPRFMFSVDRCEGYRQALDAAGIPLREEWIFPCEDLHTPEGEKRLLELFGAEDRPTAAMCMDDGQAIALGQLLSGMGLRVPEDVSLVGVNNTEASREHHPPLTTIDINPYQLGVHAMNLMLDMLKNEADAPSSVTVPFTLVKRQTVADIR